MPMPPIAYRTRDKPRPGLWSGWVERTDLQDLSGELKGNYRFDANGGEYLHEGIDPAGNLLRASRGLSQGFDML